MSSKPSKGSPKKFEVTVIYNGVAKPIEVNPNQALQAVFVHAVRLFGLQATEGLGLFTEGNVELDLNRSVEDSGIVAGTRLLLRPRQVRGG